MTLDILGHDEKLTAHTIDIILLISYHVRDIQKDPLHRMCHQLYARVEK